MTLQELLHAYQPALNAFHRASKPAVEVLLQIAGTVADAKRTLSHTDYAIFLRKTDLSPSRTKNRHRYQSYVIVGDAVSTFEPVVAHLPPSITSLRSLARLDADQLRQAVVDGAVHPLMTAVDACGIADEYGTRHQRQKGNRGDTVANSAKRRAAKPKAAAPTQTGTVRDVAGDLSLSIRFFGKGFDARKARTFVGFLRKLVAERGDQYGIAALDVSFPLELAMREMPDTAVA